MTRPLSISRNVVGFWIWWLACPCLVQYLVNDTDWIPILLSASGSTIMATCAAGIFSLFVSSKFEDYDWPFVKSLLLGMLLGSCMGLAAAGGIISKLRADDDWLKIVWGTLMAIVFLMFASLSIWGICYLWHEKD